MNSHSGGNRPFISLCMIVRDEEERLPICLESVKDYVDEIIVVDTGSIDRSTEIAADFGAKVFVHPWKNDFALHRNQSIAHAQGEWVFILDADEILEEGSGPFMRRVVMACGGDSIAVQIINPFNQGENCAVFNSVRLFKPDAGIRYEGIIHNREVGCTDTRFHPIRIHHTGYDLDEDGMRRKFQRTTSLLKAQVKAAPHDPLPHHYLAVSYLNMGEFKNAYYEEAVREGVLAIRLAGENPVDTTVLLWTHYVTAAAYANIGDLDQSERIAKEAVDLFPDHLDGHYILARVYDRRGDVHRAANCADRYLAIRNHIQKDPGRFGNLVNNSFWATWFVMTVKGKALYKLGKKEEALRTFNAAFRESNESPKASRIIGEFYFRKGVDEEAAQYLRHAANDGEDKIASLMLAECSGRQGDVRGQIGILSQILDQHPEEIQTVMEIGVAQFERANYELAEWCLGRVAEESRASEDIMEKLGIAREWIGSTQNMKQAGAVRQGKGATPRISACLIVRNEANCLGSCLESIEEHVDEIVVVDTGSDDGTDEIAKCHGARVCYHPWENDFSKHRNQSISYATGDWILQIDADETLDPESGRRMKETAGKTAEHAILFKVWNYGMYVNVLSLLVFPRLFRCGVGFHYRGIVHNQPHFPGNAGASSLSIHHYGYAMDAERMAKKKVRTEDLLKCQIAEDPHAPFPRFNMTISKFRNGDFKGVVGEGQKTIEIIEQRGIQDVAYMPVYYFVGAARYNLGDFEKAAETACKGVIYFPDNLDSLFVLALTYDQKNDTKKALEYGKRYLELHDQLKIGEFHQGVNYETFGERWVVLLIVSASCFFLHQGKQAAEYFEAACNVAPSKLFPPKERAKFCVRIGQYEEALNHLAMAV